MSSQGLPAKAQDAIISGVKTCYVDRSKEKDSAVVPESCKQLQATGSTNPGSVDLDKAIKDGIAVSNANNFINAFRAMTIYAAVLLVITFGLSLLLPRKLSYEPAH